MTIELDDNNQATALVLDLFGSERRAERQAATVTSPEALQALAGRYYSQELDAAATIELRDAESESKMERSLIYRIGTVDPEPVRLRADGSFQIPGMEAQTRAAKNGRIDGFVIDAGRVQGIEFVRLP
jgi:hypothetical protein